MIHPNFLPLLPGDGVTFFTPSRDEDITVLISLANAFQRISQPSLSNARNKSLSFVLLPELLLGSDADLFLHHERRAV